LGKGVFPSKRNLWNCSNEKRGGGGGERLRTEGNWTSIKRFPSEWGCTEAKRMRRNQKGMREGEKLIFEKKSTTTPQRMVAGVVIGGVGRRFWEGVD